MSDTPPQGTEAVRHYLAELGSGPGVYRMVDRRGNILYVGKARNLRRRVSSYASLSGHTRRIARMIGAIASMEFVSTSTEAEALLLEANLIKRLKPRYNILLTDDRSFPLILIQGGHAFPRLRKHRGARRDPGSYFGPFTSAGAVNRTINQLQKAFLLRTCSDSVFANRTRPCLLHQIRRCTAPCADLVSEADYAGQVREAVRFLSGRSSEVQEDLAEKMRLASEAQDYERAAVYRDRIRALSRVQARQGVNPRTVGEADLFALHLDGGRGCVQAVFYRSHMHWGDRTYFPRFGEDDSAGEILGAFLGQFYSRREPPPMVLLSHEVEGGDLIEEALATLRGGKVSLAVPQRGEKKTLLKQALTNAREALGRKMAEAGVRKGLLEGVGKAFGLESPPQRIEVFDSSHIQGASPVVAMVVADGEGFLRSHYRKFNMDGITAGDDLAMLASALTRRYGRLLREDQDDVRWPDLVVIDGGEGQLKAAAEAMEGLGLEQLPLVGVAKGPMRDAGREVFHQTGRHPFTLPERDPTLYFVQRLRDEAHRFAVGAHRARRKQGVRRTALDDIAGIGAARKRALLEKFGSTGEVARAGVADLAKVPGINAEMAQRIHESFREEG